MLLPSLLLFFSYISDSWFASFLAGMRLHLGMWVLLAALFVSATLRSRYSIAFILLALLSLAHSACAIQTRGQQPDEGRSVSRPSFRFMSFNLLGDNARGQDIADMIRQTRPDIIFTLESKPIYKQLEQLGQIYPYRVGCGEQTRTCDLMIQSRWPLKNIEVHTLSSYRRDRLITAEVELSGRWIQLVAIHLPKPYFGPIYGRALTNALEQLRDKDKPMLLAGDFNSSILGRYVQDFMDALQLKTIPFEPPTWPVFGTTFGLPIDHIMTRQPLVIDHLERLPDNLGSNHYGLMADIVLQQ